MTERDPLDRLQRAWDELETPPLERLDAADRALDAWLQTAWSRVPVPAARPRVRARRAALTALAAAALVCVAVGLAARRPDATPSGADPAMLLTTHAAAPARNDSIHADSPIAPAAAIAPAATSSTFPVALFASRQAASQPLVEQAYASNRAGNYREAAAYATVALDSGANDAESRCAALLNWIHAEQALGRVDEAQRLSNTLALALTR